MIKSIGTIIRASRKQLPKKSTTGIPVRFDDDTIKLIELKLRMRFAEIQRETRRNQAKAEAASRDFIITI